MSSFKFAKRSTNFFKNDLHLEMFLIDIICWIEVEQLFQLKLIFGLDINDNLLIEKTWVKFMSF